MAIDGLFLNQLITMMKPSFPMKINKISQPSQLDVIFSCYGANRVRLFISAHSITNRIQFTTQDSVNFSEPSHFLVLLRKYLEGGTIQSIEQIGLDRVVEMIITNRNEIGDSRQYRLMVELMGKYANLILVSSEGFIIDALVRIPPFENSQRTIFSGAPYSYPDRPAKKDPRSVDPDDPTASLVSTFDGFSPLLAKEFAFRMQHGEAFRAIMNELLESHDIYRYAEHFHCLELKHLNQTYSREPLFIGLDHFYQAIEQQQRISQHTGGLLKIIQREIKRRTQKLPKLRQALQDAQGYEQWKVYGDLLYAYGQTIRSGTPEVTLEDFSGEPCTIHLDVRYDGKQNAQRYYVKYHKGKIGVGYIEEQIELTENELAYFEALREQCQQADVKDASEIAQELAERRLFTLKGRKQPNKKDKKPNFRTYLIDDHTTIYVGKNNIQNDYLTFKFAHRNDYWFHVGQTFGAHVIVKCAALDEYIIRTAANLAAYYSSARTSSSVPVNYTEVKNIKKIPQKPPGFVAIQNYKTIFIDPDPATEDLTYWRE